MFLILGIFSIMRNFVQSIRTGFAQKFKRKDIPWLLIANFYVHEGKLWDWFKTRAGFSFFLSRF
jgi:hypothetical protein